MLTSASNVPADKLPPQAAAALDLELPPGTLQRFEALHREHGDMFALDLPGAVAQAYVASHPEFAKQVFCTHHAHYRRFILDGHLSLVLGRGLLISEGETWKIQRKLLQKCFHGSSLTSVVNHTLPCNAALVERWANSARRKEPVELTREMANLGIHFNFGTLFGSDAAEILADLGIEFVQQLTAPSRADTRRNLLLLRKATQARRRILQLLSSRRQWPAANADLLGFFMSARSRDGQPMTDEQIIDEIFSVLLAGHETVASALTSVWHLITSDARVAAAVRQEIDEIVGDTAPSTDHVGCLHYTRQVIQEALRLYPPVWVISHQAQCASQIGSFHVPAGTIVFVCVYLIHRHPDFWPEPERFDPSRFAAAACGERHDHAYLPHSTGPRNCIGDDLSMQEMLLHVATVLRTFDLQPVAGAPGGYSGGFTLRSTTPIRVQPRLRR
jgi:enediyne biosynthesis protein E7